MSLPLLSLFPSVPTPTPTPRAATFPGCPRTAMARRCGRAVLAALMLALALPGPASAAPGEYRATIRRTSFGIPHVLADDFGGAGFGFGYVFAQDNICVLARELLSSNAELARFFGDSGRNVENDLFYTFWSNDAVIDDFIASATPIAREAIQGYAAGYNRHLREVGPGGLPVDCRDQPWVREIDERDLFRLYYKLITRAGAEPLFRNIVAAEPPTAVIQTGSEPSTLASTPPAPDLSDPDVATRLARATEFPAWKPEEMGSYMYAIGRDASENGKGLVLVNPHFPWTGPLRWYQIHMTVPGQFDSMGVALFGAPIPLIAFNEHVAWSHTVSAARRFSIHQLALEPGTPTSYRIDGNVQAMIPTTVEIQVLEPDGSLSTREHTFWESEFGPILVLQPLISWSNASAFALQDINRRNFRVLDVFLGMNQAKSVDELQAVLEQQVALPWVNTVAADDQGNAFYGDVGPAPHITPDLFARCGNPILLALVQVFVLDGSRSECRLGSDPDAPEPGIFGASNVPKLRRTDYVQNSNDSHWLTNPDQPLEGFSQVFGGERQGVSFRTQMGIVQAQERLAGTDGLSPTSTFSRDLLQDILYGDRNLTGERFADDVVQVCLDGPLQIPFEGEIVDIGFACERIALWDRRVKVSSRGAHVWREVWSRVRNTPSLYVVPFDPDDPVETPRDLDIADPNVRTAIQEALAGAVKRLEQAGLPLDAAWGDVFFEERNGVKIPLHGGNGSEGVYNVLVPRRLTDGVGYTPMSTGASIQSVVGWDAEGVWARGTLSYSQSSDPANPHFQDQTEQLYSQSRMQELPFREEQILADPNLTVEEIAEAIPGFVQCDENGDGAFGFDELFEFMRNRFRPAAGELAVFDANGDGVLTYADLRLCAESCATDDCRRLTSAIGSFVGRGVR